MNDQANVGALISNGGGGGRLIGMGEGGGSVGRLLLQSGFNVNALRTNDVLRKDEWKLYDTEVVQIAKQRLIGVADIVSRGLVMKLNNALGTTRIEWETDTDMTPAAVTMSGIQRAQDDRIEFSLTGIPVPIIHKDWTLNIRHLEASRKTGQPLDTTMAGKAGRVVAEKIEDMLWNGYAGLGSNNTIYGFTNAQYRNTGTLSADWATATGAQIVADILAMIGALQGDHMYGPYMLYVPIAALTNMGNDFKTNSDKTILQRVLEIPGIGGVKATANLTGRNVLLVQLTSDVIQMIDGIQPTTVQWDTHGGMVMHFKVLAIMLPRVRNDSEQQSGIAHWT
jgi:uncharacterized linocin/CFP29 family protein